MRSRVQILLLLLAMISALASAQVTVTTFEGIDASEFTGAQLGVDPNGAVGTKQYLEWTNPVYQGFNKVTGAAVYTSPVAGDTPWRNNSLPDCYGTSGNVEVLFDHLASRWIIGRRQGAGTYYYCIAVSNTDDLTSPTFQWYTYELPLNSILGQNNSNPPVTYFPDYPKIGTWADGYYVTMDLENPSNGYNEVGVVVCAFDRASMLTGAAMRTPQCVRTPNPPNPKAVYLAHSLEPADIEGTIAPPTGAPEYFVSLENPAPGQSTANFLNGWEFQVNWTTPSSSKFSGPEKIPVNPYTQGCLNINNPADTICVPEPSSASTDNLIDSVADRLMQRVAYRRYTGTKPYQSWLISHAVQVGSGALSNTGIRFYEYRDTGGGRTGTISYNDDFYRFMPSIAQDKMANMAVGYSVSGSTLHPSIAASYLNLQSTTPPAEIGLWGGLADEENSYHWGVYSSMTVDPVNDCTFWYVNEYFDTNQVGSEINWQTRVSNFTIPTCN
ncbi:MAG: hypothetical protein ACLP6G_18545 [Terriglobales bacterium]